MGGISVWQLVIIALVLSGPLSGLYFVRRGPKDSLTGPLRYLNGSFLVTVILLIALFAVGTVAEPPEPNSGELPSGNYLIFMLLFYLMTCSSWYYMIALGALASRTGRSVIVWAGLPIITSPIGWIVAYFMMRNRIRTAMSPANDAGEAAPSVSETEKIAVENGSDDEASVVAQVQVACQIAGMSAGYPDDEYEKERFESYIDKALDLARDIRGEFYHSAAIDQVVLALIKDGQFNRARDLVRLISDEMVRENAEEALRTAAR